MAWAASSRKRAPIAANWRICSRWRTRADIHAPYTALGAKIAGLYGAKDGLDGYGIMQYAMTAEMGKPASFQRPPFVDLTDARKAAIEKTLREQRVQLGRI